MTATNTVQLGITMPPDIAARLEEHVGTKYGARAAWVRRVIITALEDRGETYWRAKYQQELVRRRAVEERLRQARELLN